MTRGRHVCGAMSDSEAGGAPSTTLEAEAYAVLFLHACKHPTKAVNGLLLGTTTASGVRVTRALPLFHSSFALSPMLEVALTLADEHCKLRGGISVVGYYQANELSDDMELGVFGKKIADKIRTHCAHAAILLIDGAKMRPTPSDLRLVQVGADGKRGLGPPTLAGADAAIAALDGYIGRGLQNDLVDFDAHLDDGRQDWFNNDRLLK